MSSQSAQNGFLSKLSGKVPLRIMIVIPFVALVSFAGGLTGYLSLRNGQEAVNNVASQLRGEVTARIEERVQSYLETAHKVNKLNANDIELGQLNLEDTLALEKYFWKRIQSFEEVTNIFIGIQKEGSMYGAKGIGTDLPQIILGNDSTGGSLNYYDTDTLGNREKVRESAPDYDPRVRSWYKDAVKVGESIWSPIYPEFATKALAITAAQPVYDENDSLLGVLGSTAIFTEVNEFLSSLKIGEHGETFIMERSGLLVSTSTPAPVFITKEVDRDGKKERLTERVNATQSENEIISATAQHLKEQFEDLAEIQEAMQLEFSFKGEKEFVQVSPLRDKRGLDWLVVVTIPEKDFMAQIHANTQMTIWLSVITILLTTIVGLFTAKGIIGPILRLNTASKKFAEGQWDQSLPTNRTDELGDLARSFSSMGEQVKQSFIALEEANANLEHKVEDRTKELKESQAQLVQSEKMASLGQMVAGVAHEINTPLGYVRSNVEMVQSLFSEAENLYSVYTQLLNTLTSPEATEEDINGQLVGAAELSQSFYEDDTFGDAQALCGDMVKGLDQIAELVLNLKDFSRVDSVRVQNVSVNQCLDSVLVIGHHAIGPKIEITKEYDDNVPGIECSPSHVNQVLLNIITNAAQAIDDAGKITLRTGADADKVKIEIEDNGKGIPDDVREKIFDPFFTTKPIGEGTGLGLSICYKIIEQHEGQIEVESEMGKGTKFIITLPRQTEA